MINLLLLIILTIVTAILFVLSFFVASTQFGILIPLMLLVFLGIAIEYYDELCVCCDISEKHKYFSLYNFYTFIAVVLAAVATFNLSTVFNLGPVVAAGLVGLVSAIALEKYSVPAYCGAFVGMVSQEVSQGYVFLLLAGTITGIIFVASEPIFKGFGGKLGTIAFTGCLLAAIILGRDLLSNPIPEFNHGIAIIISSVVAAVITYFINIRLKKGPVLASGLVGVIAGLLLPFLYPSLGQELAVVVICASFAGMSSKERLPNHFLVALAGFIGAIIYILSSPHLGGVGGKLGTIAFASTLAVTGLYTAYIKMKSIGQKT